VNLFKQESYHPKRNAQLNLIGRTHYVDDNTLRFHHARVLSATATDNGLLFALVESVALDYDNTRRGYRYVIFDLFGKVISRCDLESAFKSRATATKAMWRELNALDAHAITRAGIEQSRRNHESELADLSAIVDSLPVKAPVKAA